jgi:hypothetical protein
VESGLGNVDDRRFGLILGEFGLSGLGEEGPELIDVHGRAVLSVEVSSEDSDALLSEMARMAALGPVLLFEEVRPGIRETSSLSSTGWMLSVFSDSTVSVRHMAS